MLTKTMKLTNMAAPIGQHGNDPGSNILTETGEVPPHLDVSSPDFDPLKALYSSSVVIPVPDAKCFNNLSEYESFVSGRSQGRGRGQSEHAQRRRRKKELQAQAGGLIDSTKHGVPLRNVLSRMSEHTKGPYSLLYKCVQQRIKVRVCVRSFKGLRGICTGYLVAFDRDMNMALSDVDEVYRIPSTGQRFFHEEKLTYSKIIEFSKVRPKAVEDPQVRGKGGTGSSRSKQRALAKYMKGRGSQSVKGEGEEISEMTEEERRQTEKGLSEDEGKMKGERRKDGKGDGKMEDDKVLELKMEKLKQGLAQLSSSDSQSAVTEQKVGHGSGYCNKPASTSRADKATKVRSPGSDKDHLLEPMAFEKQLLRSRTKDIPVSSKATGSLERTKAQMVQRVEKCEQAAGRKSGSGKTGGGKIMIRAEDFKRRHVNQLFLRGDNVVLVSVDKGLLDTR
ncbi:uncharacterized protein [Amphiura filiformis]|uniref:uncharacterized protein n=1 Tax=Amphiura filiformis TaxID=82378 RepID=UPI003B212354